MIALHRLTHPECPLCLNPDLIQQIEATPDTVDPAHERDAARRRRGRPDEILELVREWRATILALAAQPDVLGDASGDAEVRARPADY